nr:integrase, catalytic region, zinc finger, CCHC-type, peptidase aspartic, catalytic [Tanacetum cinerariifolium]
MTIETHNWASSAHQEFHKIEADASLAKHKILEMDIERLLKSVVSQDIISVVQNASVVDTSDLQTELERRKNALKLSYKDMQQKIERLQAQLGNLKGKSKDTSSVSDTRNPLSQKLKNKNVELEFQVMNYARENTHLKATYKNLFDSISVSRCSKHMTGNLKLLINFVWKFLGTVRFENDHVAAILGFGDLQWENILITRIYFIEGLGHNLFSVGQFCDSDLEVAFR